MTIEASFLDLMPSTVTMYAKSTADAYGKVTFAATGVATRCRIQQTGRVVKSNDNRDVYETGVIIFYGNPSITEDSKIVLPDGTSPLILSIRDHNDEDGANHVTVSFGS